MIREELIEGLKLLEDNMVYFDGLLNDKGKRIDVHELLFETIEALEQESCDCISRQQALYQAMYVLELETSNDNEKVEEMLRDLPSVQPKQKTDVLDKVRFEISCHIIEDDTSGNTPVRLRADWAAANKAHMIDITILDRCKAESEVEE